MAGPCCSERSFKTGDLGVVMNDTIYQAKTSEAVRTYFWGRVGSRLQSASCSLGGISDEVVCGGHPTRCRRIRVKAQRRGQRDLGCVPYSRCRCPQDAAGFRGPARRPAGVARREMGAGSGPASPVRRQSHQNLLTERALHGSDYHGSSPRESWLWPDRLGHGPILWIPGFPLSRERHGGAIPPSSTSPRLSGILRCLCGRSLVDNSSEIVYRDGVAPMM